MTDQHHIPGPISAPIRAALQSAHDERRTTHLAADSGIPQSTLSEIRGGSDPKLSTIDKLATALDLVVISRADLEQLRKRRRTRKAT